MTTLASKIFGLSREQVLKFLPFFALYFNIFIILTLSENLAVSLFIEHIGVEMMPKYYKYTAVISMIAVASYLKFENKIEPFRLMEIFLVVLIFPFVFLISPLGELNKAAIGMAFIIKEVGFIFVFLHFGSLLQTYFHRRDLSDSIPFIYSGGRIGALFGGVLVVNIISRLGLMSLTYGLIVALVCFAFFSRFIKNKFTPLEITEPEPMQNRDVKAIKSFLQKDRFLQWLFISAFLFMICRWLLNFQSNAVLETLHKSAYDISKFMGYYTIAAMSVSMSIQMFFLSRAIRRFGIVKVDFAYNMVLLGAFFATPMPHSPFSYSIIRFVENELRFAVRNPLNQIFSNVFERSERTIARSLIIGLANPLAALSAGLILAACQKFEPRMTLISGFIMLGMYLYSCHIRYRTYQRKHIAVTKS